MMSKSDAEKCERRPFKEKIVQIYEEFLQKEDPACGKFNFWNEFFLLRPNIAFLETKFDGMTTNDVACLREIWNHIFNHCILILQDESELRCINSLQTMCILVRGIYGKCDCEYDAIEVLIGFGRADNQMKLLIEELSKILTLDHSSSLKTLVLKFLLILVTATENVSQNTLLEYFMIHSLFEAVIQLLNDSNSRQLYGYDAVLLLTILVNYRKHEAANPYIVKLSIIDSEMSLNGFGQVVSLTLSEFNRRFCELPQIAPPSSIVSSISTLVSRMFVSPVSDVERMDIRPNIAVLLALYEAIHLNRNFLICLTHCQTDASGSFTPTSESVDVSVQTSTTCASDSSDLPPTNLLVTFLEFSSIVMQSTKEEASMNTCKLCFIILTCIAEDQYANSIMHDVNLIYKVQLHRMPMRHRKVSPDRNPCRPLACPLLDLMVEFVLSHLTKTFPAELYSLCIGVVHRILCYQKRSRVRLQYNWKELWTALISLVKFLISHEAALIKSCNVFDLCVQVMNVLNLFITFGDTFLPSPTSYDELYYEIVRMNLVFDSMYSLTLRYTSSENEWKEPAAKLMNSLVNIRAIVNHFTPKIDSYLSDNLVSSLTEEQVLDVVRNNYDTLTLKLYDNLDQYEKYSEKPNETAFFTLLVRSTVTDYRETLSLRSLEVQTISKEFSTMS